MGTLKEVQVRGTWREEAWYPTKNKPSMKASTKVLSKEDAERLFSRKDFSRFSAETSGGNHG